jgi:protoheme IX farnesyltransferase
MSAVVAGGVEGVVATPLPGRLADYAQMVRPRIVVMSAVAVLAGFVLASSESVDWLKALVSVPSICLLVAASSVLNQVWESGSDRFMSRTERRPVASGRVSVLEGAVFGIALSVVGGLLLWWVANPLTSIASVLTMLTYVCVYTPLKRVTAFCTTIGAIPGAMPPVLGWLAAGGEAGLECIALFAVFFVWQFPHFLAIGWIYRDEYAAAGLRMLPSFEDGGRRTGQIALVYALAFVPVAWLPRMAGLAGDGYFWASLVLSVGYLWLTVRFFTERSDRRARQLMVGSLICLPILLGCLVLDFLRLTA